MTFLLDTHVVLWATLKPERLTGAAHQLLIDPDSAIYVSAASAWEIATKFRLGKLQHAEVLEKDYVALTARAGYRQLDILVEDGLRAGRFMSEHRDPFDRMIAAQAIRLDIPVVSADRQLDSFGIRRIW